MPGFEEIFLSAFLQALFARLLELRKSGDPGDVLDQQVSKLYDLIQPVSLILSDAEKRQLEDDGIKQWLQDLRELLYSAKGMLDDVEYEKLRCQHVRFSKVRNSPQVVSINSNRLHFKKKISATIENIRVRLEEYIKLSSNLNLRRATEIRQLEAIPYVEKIVYGREVDEKTILNFLLSKECSIANVDFIVVYGRSGIGKTTLALKVFNHNRFTRHFHVRMWVHASYRNSDNNVNVQALMKDIIEFITGSSCGPQSTSAMQHLLRQKLQGKKYFLVLDNIVNDNDDFLSAVKDILIHVGANESKVLVTTQKRSIAKLMRPTHTHELKSLSRDDCLQLIETYAFQDRKPDASSAFSRIIGDIADICSGSPLIAYKYGMLLMKTKEDEWGAISKKKVADVLELKYDFSQILPSKMKSCFAYCSMFPENFKFDKEQLVQHWCAQDFVSTEDEARDCFDEMVNCSLFQSCCFDLGSAQLKYIMPVDVRNSAQLIAGEDCIMMNGRDNHKISKYTHHAFVHLNPCESSQSFSRPNSSKKSTLESIFEAKGLHTLILSANSTDMPSLQIPKSFEPKSWRLHTLDLSNIAVHELPDSIGHLKHLRYLSLSNSKIRWLPTSVSELYHLLSLILRNCYELTKLPKYTNNLTNLRHLDLHLDENFQKRGCLISMPRDIGNLTRLQTLSRFVVSKHSRCGIRELREMNKLHGNLNISNLECVVNYKDAKEANLKAKEQLQVLELQWCKQINTRDMNTEEAVLRELRAPTKIKELKIVGYNGRSLPSWIGDPSYSWLISLKFYSCQNISNLSFSGQLPVIYELIIKDCAKLTHISAILPSLKKLEIHDSPKLNGLPQFPSLQSLTVKNSGNWIWSCSCFFNYLTSLVLSGMSVTTLKVELKRLCPNLRQLEINNFNSLISFCFDSLPETVTSLKFVYCPRLKDLSSGLRCLKAIEELHIFHCNELLYVPIGLHALRYLDHLEILNCHNLSFKLEEELPDGLRTLSVKNCSKLAQWIEKRRDAIARKKGISVWVNDYLMLSTAENDHCPVASTSTSRTR